jgi:hypothetical protein
MANNALALWPYLHALSFLKNFQFVLESKQFPLSFLIKFIGNLPELQISLTGIGLITIAIAF